MDSEQLRETIVRAQGGDAEAYESLLNSYGSRVYSYFYRATGRHHDAEDLLSELMLRLVRTLENYEDQVRFVPGWGGFPEQPKTQQYDRRRCRYPRPDCCDANAQGPPRRPPRRSEQAPPRPCNHRTRRCGIQAPRNYRFQALEFLGQSLGVHIERNVFTVEETGD